MNIASKIESGSLVHKAVQAIRAHIRQHNLKVGDPLPSEGSFASELGVSRAVMREAFGALAALKLIDVANGRRARVGAIDGTVIGASLDHAVSTQQISVAEVWDVRRTVETRIVALAAERRTDEEADQIIALAKAMRDVADDMAQITRIDIEFHETIAKAARNGLFNQIVRSFGPLMAVAVPKAWQTRNTVELRDAIINRHEAIAMAIVNRDPIGASAAMELHFDASVGELLEKE